MSPSAPLRDRAARGRFVRLGTMEERFWARVSKGSGCWLWTGSRTARGYGQLTVDATRRSIYAHRFSWELHNGRTIPDGMMICHRCDVPSCVRPEHLFLGRQTENMRDAASKGRTARGESVGSSKLTAADVRAIRRLVAEGVHTKENIGLTFGISARTVRDVMRRTWKHVDAKEVARS